MTTSTEPPEHELIRDGLLFDDIEVVESTIEPLVGSEGLYARLRLRVDPELIGTAAVGLLYTLSALSFNDARPRGFSGEWFASNDMFRSDDLLAHLRFVRGELHVDIDYLRGRCVKTTLELRSDGELTLTTVNRGEAATRWVDRIRGKHFIRAVDDSGRAP